MVRIKPPAFAAAPECVMVKLSSSTEIVRLYPLYSWLLIMS